MVCIKNIAKLKSVLKAYKFQKFCKPFNLVKTNLFNLYLKAYRCLEICKPFKLIATCFKTFLTNLQTFIFKKKRTSDFHNFKLRLSKVQTFFGKL